MQYVHVVFINMLKYSVRRHGVIVNRNFIDVASEESTWISTTNLAIEIIIVRNRKVPTEYV